VYLDTPVSVCAARDPRGLYAAAYDGRVARVTGVSDAYEPPPAAEIVLHTETQSIAACVQQLLDVVLPAVSPPIGERSEPFDSPQRRALAQDRPAPTEAPSAEAPTASEASGRYRGVPRRDP
jgi:hypothetical protein